jgi:hypothetical protein
LLIIEQERQHGFTRRPAGEGQLPARRMLEFDHLLAKIQRSATP